MKDLLLSLVTQIVDHPDDVTVEESMQEDQMILTLHTNPEDMGKVIGKNGRIIRALRDLIKLVATKQNAYVDIVLAEQNPQVSESMS
jgi:predicted RNA-binding protein YlqC (UPF0109 family)